MIELPESLTITRVKRSEESLMKRMREWIEKSDREGIHASDLLDPRMAYYNQTSKKPLSDRLVAIFTIGRILHAFVISAVEGKTLDWSADGGSFFSKELGIHYSPDVVKNKIPRELKSSRAFYLPKNKKDLAMYCEQLVIYMAALKQTKGEIWVLFLNARGTNGTEPCFRCYRVEITKTDLKRITAQLKETREKLEHALKTKNPKELPLCRKFKCGKACPAWDECKPEGRYDVPVSKWE